MTKFNGAEIIMECLRKEGVEIHLRLPRRRQPPDVRRARRSTRTSSTSSSRHEQARRPRRRRLRARHRQGRRLLGHLRPRRHQPRHRHRQRLDGLACRWSASPARSSRWLLGRDGFQEADITGITIPITKHNTLVLDVEDIAPGDRRGVPHRHDRPPGPGAGRHPARRAAGDWRVRLPGARSTCPATSRPSTGHAAAGEEGGAADRRVRAAADPRRPRRRHRARCRGAAGARGEGADSR